MRLALAVPVILPPRHGHRPVGRSACGTAPVGQDLLAKVSPGLFCGYSHPLREAAPLSRGGIPITRRAVPIQDAVLATIEDLAPSTNSYVFTDESKQAPPQLRSTTAFAQSHIGGDRSSYRS